MMKLSTVLFESFGALEDSVLRRLVMEGIEEAFAQLPVSQGFELEDRSMNGILYVKQLDEQSHIGLILKTTMSGGGTNPSAGPNAERKTSLNTSIVVQKTNDGDRPRFSNRQDAARGMYQPEFSFVIDFPGPGWEINFDSSFADEKLISDLANAFDKKIKEASIRLEQQYGITGVLG